ncbi:DNA mismatch repair endonuclease MutL [Spirochaetia bacterium 38H-sp]|uniref:DNA mismatch repair protein MutL n=1 Tax=Rarispira pelagica TaxID=3141764 RepID=A0ABU9UBF6_9SPIR
MNKSKDKASPRIHILREAVFKKIAAGEVIDRPASVVRELLDNSIDAGATDIIVEIEDGGLKKIVVTDNGSGIHPDDLEICYLPHTTSKIETESDLMAIRTLGFRGEALSSISTVSITKIYSTYQDNTEGKYIILEDGKIKEKGPVGLPRGTRIEIERIFDNYPARKRFLKTPATEAAMCKKVFLEKALSFPDISFKLIKNGNMEVFLPQSDMTERIATAYPTIFTKSRIRTLEEKSGNISIKAVLLSPSFPQRDRRNIYIYINGRNIQEYSLVQAISYGYREVLPGGQYPAAVLFAEIPSGEVDFNIHPAKKEAKIRILPELHSLVSKTIHKELRNWLMPTSNARSSIKSDDKDTQKNFNITSEKHDRSTFFIPQNYSYNGLNISETTTAYRHKKKPDLWTVKNFNQPDMIKKIKAVKTGEETNIKYLGQLFNLFLIIEKNDALFLIDQHAAHERILYNQLKNNPARQKLLIPHTFTVEEEELNTIEKKREEATNLGIEYSMADNKCIITHLPQTISNTPVIAEKWLRQQSTNSPEVDGYATIACRAAIKEGELLDKISATELAERTFELPEPYCPHGRPVWIKITKEELLKIIKRTV